jgi:ligand-binding sensor domain-containing protein
VVHPYRNGTGQHWMALSAWGEEKVVPLTLAAAKCANQPFVTRVLATLVIFLTSCTVRMAAVDPHRLISQYGHTAWRTQDGFLDRPFALTQTADGYIWVGTSSGLVRFDGVTFRPWTPPGGGPLPYITDLHGARDGALWIGTSDGLFLLRDGVLAGYDKRRGTPGISAILEDHSGTIWLTRYRLKDGEGPLCRVTGATLQCFGKNEGISSRYGLGLAEDSEGGIWFGCQALCRWAPGSSQTYFNEQFKNVSGNGVSRVAMGPSGTVWATLEGIGPKLGVQYYSGGKWSSYIVPGFDGRTVISEVLFTDRNQTLWVGTMAAGLYHVHDGFADHYGSAQGLSGNYVQSISEDKEGNIWVTTDRGIDSFRDLAVATFSANEGLVGATVHSVFALDERSVLVANEQALDIIRPDGISAITTGHGLPGQVVEAIFKDSAGQVWLGVDKKVMTYKDGHIFEVKNSDGHPAGFVGIPVSFAEDTEGNVWVLTSSDDESQFWFLRIKGNRIEEKVEVDKFFPKAHSIAADKDGGLWVLYQRTKLARYRNGKAEGAVSVTNADEGFHIQSFSVDSDNVAWVAATDGLYRGETAGDPNRISSAGIQGRI